MYGEEVIFKKLYVINKLKFKIFSMYDDKRNLIIDKNNFIFLNRFVDLIKFLSWVKFEFDLWKKMNKFNECVWCMYWVWGNVSICCM